MNARFEPQYAASDALERESLGVMANEAWQNDPQRLLFMLARYKFVARMLSNKARVVEIGAADGWAARIVQQRVYQVVCTDADMGFVRSYEPAGRWMRPAQPWNPVECAHPVDRFDAAYALDVLEHIPAKDEGRFLTNVCASLRGDGVLIVGMPSIESQQYASRQSREGHVNCKTAKELEALMSGYFHNVFSFGLNDETLHTGHEGMRHYLLCMGVGVRHSGSSPG